MKKKLGSTYMVDVPSYGFVLRCSESADSFSTGKKGNYSAA